MRSLAEILEALDKLQQQRGWIGGNLDTFHASDPLLSDAAFTNYAASIANMQQRQHDIEHEIAQWVLAHKVECLTAEQPNVDKPTGSSWHPISKLDLPFLPLQPHYSTYSTPDVTQTEPVKTDYYSELKATKPERLLFNIKDRVIVRIPELDREFRGTVEDVLTSPDRYRVLVDCDCDPETVLGEPNECSNDHTYDVHGTQMRKVNNVGSPTAH